MLDLCCGRGGASQAMRERGWRVIGVDNNASLGPDVCADVRKLPLRWYKLDLLWASIPCDEFARIALPWLKHPTNVPDLTVADAVLEIIRHWRPASWTVECSSISRRWLTPIFGQVRANSGGHALWGNLPLLLPNVAHHKERSSGLRPDIRAMVPWEISSSVALAVEAR